MFTAALLHDIGKLILSRFLDEEVSRVLAMAMQAGNMDRLGAEVEILGVHHGELGGLVTQSWELPGGIVKGVQYHHTPEEGFDTVCDATHLADQVAKAVEWNADENGYPVEVKPGSMERLGLDVDSLQELCSDVSRRVDEVTALYD